MTTTTQPTSILSDAEQQEIIRQYIIGSEEVQENIAPIAAMLWGVANPLELLYRILFPDYDLTPVHRRMIAFLWAHFHKSFQLAPRGWGKSDIRTTTLLILSVLRNPNIRIAVPSKTDTKARQLIRGARKLLEAPRITGIFGVQQGREKWGDEGFTVAGRDPGLGLGEPTVTPIGINAQIASAHYDLLLPDDLVDDENSRTQTQRDKLREKFWTELHPTLIAGGRIHASGTRHHPADLYSEFLKGLFADCYMRIPAINDEGQSNWPERYPLETTRVGDEVREGLRAKRQNMGPAIFEAQYQNKVELMEGRIIKADWIEDYYFECEPSNIEDFFKGKRLFISADLAISKDAKADEFAAGMIGIGENSEIYVGPYHHSHLTFKGQTEKIVGLWERWRRVSTVVRVGIENNQYQAAQVQAVNDMKPIGAIGLRTVKDKESRLQSISGLFEAGKIHLWRGHHADLVEQLLAFPSSTTRDDLVDMLMLAIEMSRNYAQEPFGLLI